MLPLVTRYRAGPRGVCAGATDDPVGSTPAVKTPSRSESPRGAGSRGRCVRALSQRRVPPDEGVARLRAWRCIHQL